MKYLCENIKTLWILVQGVVDTYLRVSRETYALQLLLSQSAHSRFKLCSACVNQPEERRRVDHTESNGFGNHSNHGNLPDLVQQSNSPNSTPTTALQELSDMAEVRIQHIIMVVLTNTVICVAD